MYQFSNFRKFFISDNNEQRRDIVSRQEGDMDEEFNLSAHVYYVLYQPMQNIHHPTNKIQCDSCKKDISKHTKILTEENDYCAACFSQLEEFP